MEVEVEFGNKEIEFERSCTLSKVTNSLTVTGQIEDKCSKGHGCDCHDCKVKCTDICPIVVKAERILDDDMELTCHTVNVDVNVNVDTTVTTGGDGGGSTVPS